MGFGSSSIKSSSSGGSSSSSSSSSSTSSSRKESLSNIFSPRPKDYGTAFEVNGKSFNYKPYGNQFIVGFLDSYEEELTPILYMMYETIKPHYTCCIIGKPGKLRYSNVCGANSMHICNEVRFNFEDTGFSYKKQKILIHDEHWLTDDIITKANREIIEKVFGNTYGVIGASYHALAHFTLTNERKKYYIAIETTICKPYQLQFYIGKSKEDLTEILTTRYLCSDYFLTSNCNAWFDYDDNDTVILIDDKKEPIKSSNGGKRKRRKTKRSNKRSQRKTKKRTGHHK